MENITSRDNKQIKDYIKLCSDKSFRSQTDCFAIEGVKLIVEAFNNNIPIETVFVTASCLSKKSEELEKLFQSTKVCLITDEIEKKMSTQKSGQGVFAVCKSVLNHITLEEIKQNGGKYVMLCDLQDTGNVGTIIRTAEALGMDGIILTNTTCDLLNPKVIRATMGSVFRIKTMIVDDAADTVDSLNAVGARTMASVVDADVTDINQISPIGLSVLLIGNEGNGLSNDIINACSDKVTIKMQGNAESLNAGMAACILMWEISKK